jgi:hypothetical protein
MVCEPTSVVPLESSPGTQGDGVAAIRSAVTIESARAVMDLLTSGLPEHDRRMAVLGILAILYDLHTQPGGVAPAWLLALMAEAAGR